MSKNCFLLVFLCMLYFKDGEGFFSQLMGRGRRQKNNESSYVDVCETVRVMPRIAMAVVGGSPVRMENSAPYIAAVGEKTSNGSISWFCGGSLISLNHILTAAHCLVSRNVSTIRVGSFSTMKRSTVNDYEVLKTIIHPEYKITESYHDIGIIKTKNTISFDNNIKPVCLPQTNNQKFDKERAKVIGWGAEEFGGDGTQKLRQVEVEVFTNSNCEKAYMNSTIAPKTFPRGIKSEQLCAGSKTGGKDACQGDSGGPLVLTDENGIVRQIGIVSTGAGCGFKMYPGVYTRVSSYTDWIQNQINQDDSSEPVKKNNSKNNRNKNFEETHRPTKNFTETNLQGNTFLFNSFKDKNKTAGYGQHTDNSLTNSYNSGHIQPGKEYFQNYSRISSTSFENYNSNERRSTDDSHVII